MRCFHRCAVFDVVYNTLFVDVIYLHKAVNVQFSAFFAWITLVVEVFAEVYGFGGMLHVKVVSVEPEFALADVEVVDGGACDGGVVWVLHL